MKANQKVGTVATVKFFTLTPLGRALVGGWIQKKSTGEVIWLGFLLLLAVAAVVTGYLGIHEENHRKVMAYVLISGVAGIVALSEGYTAITAFNQSVANLFKQLGYLGIVAQKNKSFSRFKEAVVHAINGEAACVVRLERAKKMTDATEHRVQEFEPLHEACVPFGLVEGPWESHFAEGEKIVDAAEASAEYNASLDAMLGRPTKQG